jgi:hypothetical protein
MFDHSSAVGHSIECINASIGDNMPAKLRNAKARHVPQLYSTAEGDVAHHGATGQAGHYPRLRRTAEVTLVPRISELNFSDVKSCRHIALILCMIET